MSENKSIIYISAYDSLIRQILRQGFLEHAKANSLPWDILDLVDQTLISPSADLVVTRGLLTGPNAPPRNRQLICACQDPDVSSPYVWFDDLAIGRLAAQHAIEQGWRNGLVISRPESPIVRQDREHGFAEEYKRRGFLCINACAPFRKNISEIQIWRQEVLQNMPRPCVVFCYQDREAEWMLTALQDLGYKIPGDFGLISCEDTPVARNAETPFSSVRTPWSILAKRAALSAQQYLSSGQWDPPQPIQPLGVAQRKSTHLIPTDDPLIIKALSLIQRSMPAGLRVSALAKKLECSPITLGRRCKEGLGTTPHHLILRYRLMEAERLLAETPDQSVERIATRCGWSDSSHFSRDFRKYRGTSPGRFRLGETEGGIDEKDRT